MAWADLTATQATLRRVKDFYDRDLKDANVQAFPLAEAKCRIEDDLQLRLPAQIEAMDTVGALLDEVVSVALFANLLQTLLLRAGVVVHRENMTPRDEDKILEADRAYDKALDAFVIRCEHSNDLQTELANAVQQGDATISQPLVFL